MIYVFVFAWLLGLVFGTFFKLDYLPISLCLAMLMAFVWRTRNKVYFCLAVTMLASLLGVLRSEIYYSRSDWANNDTPSSEYSGKVLDKVSNSALVSLSSPHSGTWLLVGSITNLTPGDHLYISGSSVPFYQLDGFLFRYSLSKGAHGVIFAKSIKVVSRDKGNLQSVMAKVRNSTSSLIRSYVGYPYSSVAESMILGNAGNVPKDIERDFRESGLSHILVASGFNVTILVLIVIAFLRPLIGIRGSMCLAFILVPMYMGLSGMSSPVVRASVMAVTSLWGRWIGRQNDSGRSLCFALLLISALQPFSIYDIGMQLSVLATASIIWLYPSVARAMARLPELLRETVSISFVAQASTMPLLIFYFGKVSHLAILANVLIAPLIPLEMILTVLTVVLGVLSASLGSALGWLTGKFVLAIVYIANSISEISAASELKLIVGPKSLVLYYLVFVAVILLAQPVARRYARDFWVF